MDPKRRNDISTPLAPWLDVPRVFSQVGFADVDGDKRVDFVGIDEAGVHVWLSNGTQFVGPIAPASVTGGSRRRA